MKKKIVFFGYNMEMGGAERALLNVINVVKNYFEIDLVLIQDKGVLMKEIPDCVNVITIRKNNFIYALFRYIPFFRKKTIRRITNKKNYDIAVAFMEGRAATWLVDMNQNCKKIAWIHNDVNMFDIGITENEINRSYSKVDEIVVVSKHSMNSFCQKYKVDNKKVRVIYNLINEKDIIEKSKLQKIKKTKTTFINVAKMRPQKRHDRLLEATKKLLDAGYDFELWLIGNGPLEEEIEKKYHELELEKNVKLLGLQENPFPYIKTADWFVMSSDHEGYPLSLLESLLLKTPVITTDVSGAKEILENGKYGIICDINTDSLIESMKKVLDGKENINIHKNLQNYKGTNEEIVKDLKKLFMIKM